MSFLEDSVDYKSDTTSEERPSQLSRTTIHATFQIAHPPPKPHQRLRLTPKLLLQIQQLVPNHRPVPVLEIWQPPFRKFKLTRDFAQRLKLGTGDIYATLDEPYVTADLRSAKKHARILESREDGDRNDKKEKDIVAVMCRPSGNAIAVSTIYFRDPRRCWLASTETAGLKQPTPIYRFMIKNDDNGHSVESCNMLMQWEKRLPAEIPTALDEDHFILLVIDRQARRKSRIATMNRGGLEITIRKSSVIDHLRLCLGLSDPGEGTSQDLETALYTHVLTLGVWLACREGWLN